MFRADWNPDEVDGLRDSPPIQFEIQNVAANVKLSTLAPGQKYQVRYRSRPWWPLKRQDPLVLLGKQALGVERDEFVGFVTTDQSINVVVRGGSGD